MNWNAPQCLKEVRSFIDFCNFFQRFIKNFNKITHLLMQLSDKNKWFDWMDVCQKAFEPLKKTVTESLMFTHFDQTQVTILKCDSLDDVSGDVLLQYRDDGLLHPVTFFSKNLIPAKCNYKIYNKELLMIIRCLENWQSDLKSTEISVKIFTDHKVLIYFMKSKELIWRQAYWVKKLSEFNFKIQYQTSPQNAKADALSRLLSSFSLNHDDSQKLHQHQTLLIADWLEASLMKLTLITPEPLNLKEANILSVTDNLVKDHALKINSKHDSEDLSSPLFERAAEVNKTDSKCLTVKRV